MPMRPGQAKGPNLTLGGGGGGAPVDAQYVVMALDGTLTNERVLTAGYGIDITDGGAGSTVTINALGNIPTFHDDFETSKPYWEANDAITSGDWTVDTANENLKGIAQNNTRDVIKYGIEGDVDMQFHITRGSASSHGVWLIGNSIEVRFVRLSGNMRIECTGETAQTPVVGADTMWIRVTWDATGVVKYYWKINTADAWTLQTTFTGKDLGHDKQIAIDSATNGLYHEMIIWDNMQTHQIRSLAPKKIILTDASTIAVDASKGNFYTVTLGGNRTLGNPVNPLADGQKIMLRVTQDGTGSRTLGYDTKYRFSTALPSPTLSTGANKIDYLGFVYHKSDDKWDFVAFVKGF